MSTQIDRLGGAKGSLAWKAPCTVATTANITLSGHQTVDGTATTENMRVLVKDQTNAYENGIYLAKTAVWVRTKDFDGNTEVVRGTRVYVTDGIDGQGEYTITNTSSPVRIGDDDIIWTKESPVVGPNSSIDGNLAAFNGAGGAILQDSGVAATSILSSANIGSTGTNGIQAYAAPSTDVVIASDIGSTTSINAVQSYFGTTGTLLTTSHIGSTSGNNAVEPSHGLPSFSVSYNSSFGGTYVPNSDNGRFQDVTNNAGEATISISAPSNIGMVISEVVNSTRPGVFDTVAYDIVLGSPSTEPSVSFQAVILRTNTIQSIEWKSTV